jgi:hypothetical protein
LLVTLAAAVLVLFGGGTALAVGLTRTSKPAAAASPSPSWSPIDWGKKTPAIVQIPTYLQQACDLTKHMRDSSGGDLRDQGATINKIKDLAGTSDIFDVRFAANMLKDRYDLAVASGGTADVINLLTASIRMETACIQSGWRP